jgi:hypothetical protein
MDTLTHLENVTVTTALLRIESRSAVMVIAPIGAWVGSDVIVTSYIA